jgi:hypothetical protein
MFEDYETIIFDRDIWIFNRSRLRIFLRPVFRNVRSFSDILSVHFLYLANFALKVQFDEGSAAETLHDSETGFIAVPCILNHSQNVLPQIGMKEATDSPIF